MTIEEVILSGFNGRSIHNPTSSYFFKKLALGYTVSELVGKTEEERNDSLTIPPEMLKVLVKVYHRKYPDVGRKRGALIRWVKELSEKHEEKEGINLKLFEKWIISKSNK